MIKPAGHGAGRGKKQRTSVRPELRRDIPPEGWRGEKPMAAREWRLVGRQFGRIAAVSQLFSVLLFPQLFSTLHCASRSASRRRLTGLPTAAPDRYRSPPLRLCLLIRHEAKASLRYTANFSLLSLFRRRTKRQRWPKQITGKSILLFPLHTYRVVVTGRSSHAVWLRSTFFPFRIFGCCIIYAGAVITAWSSAFVETFTRSDARRRPIVVSRIYLTSLAGRTFSCNVQ